MTSNSEFPLLQKAPLMIRESLVFPYGDGLTFEAALLHNRGKDPAFSGAFRRPPQDTHEILDVSAYLTNHPVEWLVLPDLTKQLGSNYEKYDEGSIGQLDTRILIEQYADKETAQNMGQAWRGGAYYAAESKDAKVGGTAKIGLLYLSRWESEESADQFAKLYAVYVPKRYTKAVRLTQAQAADKFCAGSSCATSDFFQTEEGWVAIQRVDGPLVLVTEGFDPATARSIEQQILSANPAHSIEVQRRSLMSPLRTSAVLQEAIGRMVMKKIADLGSARR